MSPRRRGAKAASSAVSLSTDITAVYGRDCGRERLQRDVDQLAHPEGRVLKQRTLAAHENCCNEVLPSHSVTRAPACADSSAHHHSIGAFSMTWPTRGTRFHVELLNGTAAERSSEARERLHVLLGQAIPTGKADHNRRLKSVQLYSGRVQIVNGFHDLYDSAKNQDFLKRHPYHENR
jgi:hypothetical protein